MAKKLSAKQQAFIDEYLIDLNASAAARRAGYSPNTAFRSGQENMQNPAIRDEIDRRLEERSDRVQIDADRVMLELARLGLHDARRLFTESGRLKNIHDLDDDTAAAIQSIEVVTRELPRKKGEEVEVEYVHKVKMADKIRPLELIGKHLGKRLGQWGDRVEHDVPSDSPLAALVKAINGKGSTLAPVDDENA